METLRLFKRQRLDIETLTGLEVVLRENRPLRLAGARGRRILCTAGCAWITAPGVADDIFLHGGEAWVVAGDGLVLVEAVGSAAVAIGMDRNAKSVLGGRRGEEQNCAFPLTS
jgi:hypothetical protein